MLLLLKVILHIFIFCLLYRLLLDKKVLDLGFPVGPLVRILPSSAGGVDSIPGLGAKTVMPGGPKTKT